MKSFINIKFNLYFLICVLLLTSCAAKRPGWIRIIPHDKQYFYAVGIKTGASTLEEGKRSAVQQAVSELVGHFELQSRVRYEEQKTELVTKVMDEIRSLSGDVKIKGTLISDWHFEKTEIGGYDVYVLLQYPRVELERERARQQSEASEKISRIQGGLINGDRAAARGDVGGAIDSFVAALTMAARYDETSLHSGALERLNQLVGGIQVRIASGNNQKIDMSRKDDYQLAAEVVLNKGGDEIPVSGVPVRFSFPDLRGTEAVSIKSDKGGMAVFRIPRLSAASKEYNVQAALDADQILIIPSDLTVSDQKFIRNLRERLRSRSADFTFDTFMTRKDIRVVVLIDEENYGTSMHESIVGNALSKGLFDAGYQVIAVQDIGKTNMDRLRVAIEKDEFYSLNKTIYGMVDVVVSGTGSTREGSSNMGVAISSHADGFVKAIDLRTGAVVAQENVLDAVGFGETRVQAGINALKKMGASISDKIVSQLLENSATNK